MRQLLFLTVALAALAPAAPSQAQRGQREPHLSERAFGLGGAVLGSAAGPSSAYYNPAGLADTPGTSAGATLSLRTFRSYTVVDGYNSVLGLDDLTDSGLLSVPVFLGAVLKFGPRDATNIREHALGAGMLVRSQLDRELLVENADLNRGIAASLEVFDRQEERWFYAAYAWRPSNQLSIGLTAAVANDDREYREIDSQGTNLTGGFEGADGLLSTRQARIDYSVLSLLFRLGVSWRPSDWIQLSAMFQIPGIELFDSGSALFQRVTANTDMTGDPSSYFRVDLEDVDAQGSLPWQLRLGVYARLDHLIGFALDVGVTGTQGDANNPVSPLGRDVPVDEGRAAATYFADRYWTDVAFDAALGVEISVTEQVPLRVGGFLEVSGMPSAFGERNTYSPDRLDRVGVNIGFGVHDDNYDFGLGVGYVHGYGQGLRPADAFAGGYEVTDVQSHEISFFLSGVTGAATQLALDTYTAITGRGFSETEVEEDAIDQHLDDVPELQTDDEREDQLHDQVEHEMNLPRWIHDVADGEGEVEHDLGERLDEVETDEPHDTLLDELEESESEGESDGEPDADTEGDGAADPEGDGSP